MAERGGGEAANATSQGEGPHTFTASEESVNS